MLYRLMLSSSVYHARFQGFNAASQDSGSILLGQNEGEAQDLAERASLLQSAGLSAELLDSEALKDAEPGLAVSAAMSGLFLGSDAQIVSYTNNSVLCLLSFLSVHQEEILCKGLPALITSGRASAVFMCRMAGWQHQPCSCSAMRLGTASNSTSLKAWKSCCAQLQEESWVCRQTRATGKQSVVACRLAKPDQECGSSVCVLSCTTQSWSQQRRPAFVLYSPLSPPCLVVYKTAGSCTRPTGLKIAASLSLLIGLMLKQSARTLWTGQDPGKPRSGSGSRSMDGSSPGRFAW